MKRLHLSTIIYSFLFLLISNWGFAQNYSNFQERIIDFHTEIVVDTTSKITVTEKIKVQANNLNIQRGIYRTLPTKRNVQEKTFYVKYDIKSVKKDGVEEPFHSTHENGNYVIYIGDKDVYLPPSVYEYEIVYETYRQVGFFEDFDELYWNSTGNYWNFPIESASATIHLPEGTKMLQNACYTGQYRSSGNSCDVKILSPTTIQWTAKNLSSGEGLTVAVGFSKGIVHEPELPAALKTNNLSKILGGFSGLLLAFFGFLWYRFGIDPKKPTVVPQFKPPMSHSPASIGYLNNGKYNHNLLTATFINLAVKGLIKIEETSKSQFFGLTKSTSYKIIKLKNDAANITTEERNLLNSIYGTLTIDGEYNSSIASLVNEFRENVTDKNKPLIHKGNNRNKLIVPFLVISGIYWLVLIFSYLNLFNINKLIFGIFLYVGMFLYYIFIYATPTLRYKSLFFWIWPLLPLGGFFLYWKFIDNQIEPFNLAYVFLIVSFILLSFFKFFIERPDPEYLQQVSLIEGFKMYLSAAENQLIKFHNPPKMTPELFEKMLPYAMVLGVDGIWGEKFNNYLKTNNREYKNDWFTGGMHGFTSNIGNSFSDGFSRSIASSTIAPSSSGSGSGGGGFSGGGGGGGGGGGW